MVKRLRRWWNHVSAQAALTKRARELMLGLGDKSAGQVKDDEIRTLMIQIGVAHLEGLAKVGWHYSQEQETRH